MAVSARQIDAMVAVLADALLPLIAGKTAQQHFKRLAQRLSKRLGCRAAALVEVSSVRRTVRLISGWSQMRRGRLLGGKVLATDEALQEMALGMLEAAVYVQPSVNGGLPQAFFEEGCDAVVAVNLLRPAEGQAVVLAVGLDGEHKRVAESLSLLVRAVNAAAQG